MESYILFVHRLAHTMAGVDFPHAHWWMVAVATIIFIVAPAGLALHLGATVVHAVRMCGRRRARLTAAIAPRHSAASSRNGAHLENLRDLFGKSWELETFILRATARWQIRLIFVSLLTIPAAWYLLDIPKHIINHALSSPGDAGMTFLGFEPDRVSLLFALSGCYLVALSVNVLLKFVANGERGRINERVVRRLRLAIIRRAAISRAPEARAALAAVAVQEVEPIGYFGGSLAVTPVINGGALLTSLVFLATQNLALAFAAIIMLPVQLTLLPRVQRAVNVKVRERVLITRAFGSLLTYPGNAYPEGISNSRDSTVGCRSHVSDLERVRLEINRLKGLLKGLHNYTSSLTPFFFFSIGGYLVTQDRMSLGALVAALAAHREIAPSVRELFDFAQAWSDARARHQEIGEILGSPDLLNRSNIAAFAHHPRCKASGGPPTSDLARHNSVSMAQSRCMGTAKHEKGSV